MEENVARLEENVRQRDTEIVDYSACVVEREMVAEQLREQISNLKREHSRIKAEADMAVGTLKERDNTLKEEVSGLRRQVHELQQESADKEVKLVQLMKQRSQDKEDIHGLNIALDSKQQELELVSPFYCFHVGIDFDLAYCSSRGSLASKARQAALLLNPQRLCIVETLPFLPPLVSLDLHQRYLTPGKTMLRESKPLRRFQRFSGRAYEQMVPLLVQHSSKLLQDRWVPHQRKSAGLLSGHPPRQAIGSHLQQYDLLQRSPRLA